MDKLNAKQEAFANEVVKNGGDKVAAFKASGWKWDGYSSAALSVQADKQFNHPKISLRINELKKQAKKVAKEKFSITIEQRLDLLGQVARAGLEQRKNEDDKVIGYENLSATNQAVKIMNEMLGVSDDGQEAESLSISFAVKSPVGDVKITRGS